MRLSTVIPFLATLPPILAIPKQPTIPTNTTSFPKNYAVLVFPGFQSLDVFGPLDVLAPLALFYNESVHVSIISRTMEPVSTIPNRGGMQNMSHGAIDFGWSIMPTTTTREVLAKAKLEARHEGNSHGGSDPMPGMDKGDIEVLIVPGGMGTRDNVTEEIEFVRAMYPKLRYVISVCTGSTILARAGILDGRKATGNKRAWQWATSTGPEVNWVPTARWVQDGNIWTSSGVAAGIDLTYAWVAHWYGEEASDYIGYNQEYRKWEGGAENDPFAKIWEVPGS